MAHVRRKAAPAKKILKAALKELDGRAGKVGWFASSFYEDGTPVAYVAAIQEFGYPAGGIPPRMGMRQLAKEKRASWAKVAERNAKQMFAGKMSGDDALELLGAVAEGDLRKHINKVTEPPLADSTLEARQRNLAKGDKLTKTGSKPLNDSGYMIATLTHVVHEEGEE